VHLDAGLGGIPASTVAEVFDVEVCSEVAVEAGEDVEVESGGGSCGVVIGSEERGYGLVGVGSAVRCEIGAKEQGVAGQ